MDFREVTCYSCGRKGHISQQCPSWNNSQQQQPQVNTIQTYNTDYGKQEPMLARMETKAPPKHRPVDWLAGEAGKDNKVNALTLQPPWNKQTFPNAQTTST